jgi:16S rRNA (guanine966-N2)-methyltransferase
VRPTQDRIRESLFSILGGKVQDCVVLDAFAGSGALGIEALSRGAARAVFCDEALECTRTILGNLEACEMMDRAVVLRTRLPGGLVRVREALLEPCDLVFLDPPYGMEEKGLVLEALHQFALLKEHARIVFEHSEEGIFANVPAGFRVEDARRYGGTVVTFLNYQPGSSMDWYSSEGSPEKGFERIVSSARSCTALCTGFSGISG